MIPRELAEYAESPGVYSLWPPGFTRILTELLLGNALNKRQEEILTNGIRADPADDLGKGE